MTSAPTTPADPAGEERRGRALRLYLAGADQAAIAKALRYTEDEARADVHTALEERLQAGHAETKELQRTAAALQLDQLQSKLWGKLQGADPDTAEKIGARLLQIIDRRIKLLGLDRRPPPPPHLYESPPPRLGAST